MVLARFAFLFCLAAVCLAKDRDEESKDPLAKAFHSLRSEERTDFLSYFLAHGVKEWAENQPRGPKFISDALIKGLEIPEDRVQKFENMRIPKESKAKLLEWTKKEFHLTTRNVIDLIKTKKCQGENCVRFPDIGEICCPW